MPLKPTHYLLAAVMLGALFLSYSSNPPDARTGAPGEGLCSGCHSGGVYSGNVSISGVPSTVMAGETYTVTLTTTATGGNPLRSGFQIVALNSSNQNTGDLKVVNGNETGTDFSGGREYLEHRGSKAFSGDQVSWTFEWQAPAGPNNETITFYFSSILANNNGQQSGDNVVNSNFSILLQAASPPTLQITQNTPVSCNGGSDGSATAAASGGTPPYTYSWSNGQNGPNLTNVPAGNYSVTVTDNAGQSANTSTNITEPSALQITIQGAQPITCVNPQAQIIVMAFGGTPGYSYAWSTGASGPQSAIGLADLPATVTVTDDKGCTATLDITDLPQENNPPGAMATGGTITCIQPQVTLFGSSMEPIATYQWLDPQQFPLSNQPQVSVNLPGTYTLVVTNPSNGCTSTATAVVLQDISAPEINLGLPDTLSCLQPQIALNAGGQGNLTYFWTTLDGRIVSGQDSAVAIVDAGGTYSVIVTQNENGCFTEASTTVQAIAPPQWSIDSLTNLNCATGNNGLAWLRASAGTPPFQWLWADGNSTPQGEDLAPGTYVISLTDGLGCLFVDSLTLLSPPALQLLLSKTDETAPGAMDGTATALPSGGTPPYSLLWSNGETTAGIDELAPGAYQVTLRDSFDCILTASVSIQPFGCDLQVSAEIKDARCSDSADGEILLNVIQSPHGDVQISWSNGASGALLTNIPAGTYIVTVSDSIGCVLTDTLLVQAPSPLVIDVASATPPSGPSANDGMIEVQVSGGTPPYTYAWTDENGPIGDDFPVQDNLSSGLYTLNLTDAQGCVTSLSIPLIAVRLDAPWAGSVHLFPVPLNQILELHLPEGQTFKLRIWNTRGTQLLELQGLRDRQSLLLPNGPAGLYLIQLEDEQGRTAQWKVMRS